MIRRNLAAALVVAALVAAAAPGIADHAAACKDLYFCVSGGRVLTVTGTLGIEGGEISITAEHHQAQRLSSAGHADIDEVSATVTLRMDGMAPASCSPEGSTILYEASDVIDDVRVASTDPNCSFDLTWTSSGTAPDVSPDRRTEVVPGVPPEFTAILSVGVSASIESSVAGTILDRAAEGSGEKEEHEYIGHVTVIR